MQILGDLNDDQTDELPLLNVEQRVLRAVYMSDDYIAESQTELLASNLEGFCNEKWHVL